METILDDPKQLAALDRGGMLETLHKFPESCMEAVEAVEALTLDSLPYNGLKAVAVAGVGGSAIGGQILRDWLLKASSLPIYVSRGYHLPRFIDEETLVFAVSYSGNTEETLSALEEALERGAPVISVTSGGKMKAVSVKRRIQVLPLPRGLQPRAALPHQFFSLAVVMRRLGPAFELWDEVYEVFELLESLKRDLKPETPTAFNPAKKLALGLSGKIPFVYGPKQFDAVAYRFKTQFNENSKIPAASGFFPEAFHNSVMGCEGPEEVRNSTCALIIRDPDGSPEMVRKTEVFKKLLESSGIRVLELYAQGKGTLARIFSTIYIGDYASTYLGLLYGLDPGSTDSINALKKG